MKQKEKFHAIPQVQTMGLSRVERQVHLKSTPSRDQRNKKMEEV